jgi:hypothetical protein
MTVDRSVSSGLAGACHAATRGAGGDQAGRHRIGPWMPVGVGEAGGDADQSASDQRGCDEVHSAVGTAGSDTPRAATTVAASVSATVAQKTACQPACCTSRPPASGPTAKPGPETPAHTPIAAGSLSSGNASASRDSDCLSDESESRPNPCRVRYQAGSRVRP